MDRGPCRFRCTMGTIVTCSWSMVNRPSIRVPPALPEMNTTNEFRFARSAERSAPAGDQPASARPTPRVLRVDFHEDAAPSGIVIRYLQPGIRRVELLSSRQCLRLW